MQLSELPSTTGVHTAKRMREDEDDDAAMAIVARREETKAMEKDAYLVPVGRPSVAGRHGPGLTTPAGYARDHAGALSGLPLERPGL